MLPVRKLSALHASRNHEGFYGLSREALPEGGVCLACFAIDCSYITRFSFRLLVYCSFLGQPIPVPIRLSA